VRQTFPAIKRGQPFHHGLDKVRIRPEKPVKRLLYELVRGPAIARRKLDKASFL
jgi:hypothetical protein